MRILAAIASRHGSTREIGDRMADRLRAAGHTVDTMNAAAVTEVTGYDAALVGSAIYLGNWEQSARSFVDTFADELRGMPVWVFSSGPIGALGDEPGGIPGHLAAVRRLQPVGDRVFAGRLERDRLSVGERLAARIVKAPEGDFRDWGAIERWAETVTEALGSRPAGEGCP